MEIQKLTELKVLDDAQDLFVVGRSRSNNDKYTYIIEPSLRVQQQLYNESLIDKDIRAFKGPWKFDEYYGVTRGFSHGLGLRLDQHVLRPMGLWLPGLLETAVLPHRCLKNNLHHCGFVLYDTKNPNKIIAEELNLRFQEMGLELPLFIPFRDLKYNSNEKRKYGIALSIVESTNGIISGEAAVTHLSAIECIPDSGFQGLLRSENGWSTSEGIAQSNGGGRYWICGEATLDELTKAYERVEEIKYGVEMRQLRKLKMLRNEDRAKFEIMIN